MENLKSEKMGKCQNKNEEKKKGCNLSSNVSVN